MYRASIGSAFVQQRTAPQSNASFILRDFRYREIWYNFPQLYRLPAWYWWNIVTLSFSRLFTDFAVMASIPSFRWIFRCARGDWFEILMIKLPDILASLGICCISLIGFWLFCAGVSLSQLFQCRHAFHFHPPLFIMKGSVTSSLRQHSIFFNKRAWNTAVSLSCLSLSFHGAYNFIASACTDDTGRSRISCFRPFTWKMRLRALIFISLYRMLIFHSLRNMIVSAARTSAPRHSLIIKMGVFT